MADFTSAQIELIFPHPFLRYTWSDSAALNSELRRAILAEERRKGGIKKSNSGGWHSDTGELEFCGAAGRAILDRAAQLANHATTQVFQGYGFQAQSFGWTVQAWANVSRQGNFNRVHNHPGSTWSGTYYVDSGIVEGRRETTPLSLFDPCQARASTFFPSIVPNFIYVAPEPGLMVLFPSYIQHMVTPHKGSEIRISIAFNLRKEPFP